jgi:hypothetical protein
MILVVTVMLVLMSIGCRLNRSKGFILVGFSLLYLFLTFHLFL